MGPARLLRAAGFARVVSAGVTDDLDRSVVEYVGPPPAGPSDAVEYVGQPPADPAPAWPAPAEPGAPTAAPRRRSGLLVAALVAVSLLVVAGAIGLLARAAHRTRSPHAGLGASASALRSGRPTLKQVTPRSVVGPMFDMNDSTYLMGFAGWPFAFRTPHSWGCMGGQVVSVPDARGWLCVDEQHPGDRQRVQIVLRRCPTTCTDGERQQMNADGLKEPAKAVPGGDDRTVYVEVASNAKGLYSVDLSRFFAERTGQPLRWQVGVYVESPPDTRAEVQKILNDIVTQTP
jgi:hypothetical protein